MRVLFDFLVGVPAFGLLVPSVVYGLECLVGGLPGDSGPRPRDVGPVGSVVVVIPAHDEEAMIAATLEGLRDDLPSGARVLVVADNCTDATARVARQAGVEVIERHDDARRGKGYALAFALSHLEAAPPDVVVVLDADCQVAPGTLATLAAWAVASGRPVQAEYLLTPPPDPTPMARVSALAVLVRNRVRPLGLHRAGLPCQLTGSGMAFPWAVLRAAPPTGAYLVEDLLMGIELAALGHPPLFCPEAAVRSTLPTRDEAAAAQRRRWEHGQLTTMLLRGPSTIARGVAGRRRDLVALGLDLCVPPLALLLGALVLTGMSSVVAGLVGGTWWPAVLVALALAYVTAGTALAWLRHGTTVLPPRALVSIPRYVLWKLPSYLAFFRRKGETRWIRTARDAQASTEVIHDGD